MFRYRNWGSAETECGDVDVKLAGIALQMRNVLAFSDDLDVILMHKPNSWLLLGRRNMMIRSEDRRNAFVFLVASKKKMSGASRSKRLESLHVSLVSRMTSYYYVNKYCCCALCSSFIPTLPPSMGVAISRWYDVKWCSVRFTEVVCSDDSTCWSRCSRVKMGFRPSNYCGLRLQTTNHSNYHYASHHHSRYRYESVRYSRYFFQSTIRIGHRA